MSGKSSSIWMNDIVLLILQQQTMYWLLKISKEKGKDDILQDFQIFSTKREMIIAMHIENTNMFVKCLMEWSVVWRIICFTF